MSITIEKPTAEAAFEALQALPESEMARLKTMFLEKSVTADEDEEAAWHQASAHSAARFFEDEEE